MEGIKYTSLGSKYVCCPPLIPIEWQQEQNQLSRQYQAYKDPPCSNLYFYHQQSMHPHLKYFQVQGSILRPG